MGMDEVEKYIGRRCRGLRRFDWAKDAQEYVLLTKTAPPDWLILACPRCSGVHVIPRSHVFMRTKNNDTNLRVRFRTARDHFQATPKRVAAAIRYYAIANSMTVSEAAPHVDALFKDKKKYDVKRELDRLTSLAGNVLRDKAKEDRRRRKLYHAATPPA